VFPIIYNFKVTNFLNKIKSIIGTANLLTGPDNLEKYGQDWTRLHTPKPLAIALPSTTDQVSNLVKLANKHHLAIVPSGGRTGMSGGAVAINGELVVSLERMNQILDLNIIDRTVTCQAGVITKNLQDYAAEQGLFYPVNFASSGSSQIGGNIATNAGGIKVIHYGNTRDWVAGLKIVTGTGEVLSLNKGLQKNNTGYDLRHLLIGSEGTLGIITEAILRLTTPPQNLAVLLLGAPDIQALLNAMEVFQQHCTLTAFEFFTNEVMQLTLASLNQPHPLDQQAPVYALVEIEQHNPDDKDYLLKLFGNCVNRNWLLDGLLSQSGRQFQKLWRLRESMSEAVSQQTPYRNDIAVRTSLLAKFISQANEVLQQREPKIKVACFGHAGDGNVHYNLLKPEDWSQENFLKRAEAVMTEVFAILEKYGGSVAAEHGIGLLKKPHLHHSRTPLEIGLMRQIKKAFDPNAVLNPGKIFDL